MEFIVNDFSDSLRDALAMFPESKEVIMEGTPKILVKGISENSGKISRMLPGAIGVIIGIEPKFKKYLEDVKVIEIIDSLPGAGGDYNPETKTVRIASNTDPWCRYWLYTLLHEIGHVRQESITPINLMLYRLEYGGGIFMGEYVCKHEAYADGYAYRMLKKLIKNVNSRDYPGIPTFGYLDNLLEECSRNYRKYLMRKRNKWLEKRKEKRYLEKMSNDFKLVGLGDLKTLTPRPHFEPIYTGQPTPPPCVNWEHYSTRPPKIEPVVIDYLPTSEVKPLVVDTSAITKGWKKRIEELAKIYDRQKVAELEIKEDIKRTVIGKRRSQTKSYWSTVRGNKPLRPEY